MLKRKLKYFKVLIIIFILTISFFSIIPFVFAEPVLVDSYSETNYDSSLSLQIFHPSDSASYFSAGGQCFTMMDTNKVITSAKFYLYKFGSPTGNVHAVLYALTGTIGVDGEPTGSPLATSDDFDVSTLTDSYQLTTFTFSGAEQYEMIADAYYCIVFENPLTGTIDTDNYIYFGKDNSSPTHGGNVFYYYNSIWLPVSSQDGIFYVYGDIPSEPDNEPFYSDVGYDSVTQVGESADFWVFWEDDFNLETCYFSTNSSGSWYNHTLSVSGVSSWANKTLQLNYTSSVRVEYKWFCSDNASQWSDTSTYFLITTSLYITFNFNNSTMGKFYVDYVNTANETQKPYNYNESILLDGIQLSSDYSFLNFTWISDISLSNNYDYYTSGNNTIWCYFGLSGVGGIDESYFVLGFVIAGCAILFMVIVLKSDKKEK